MKVLIRSKSDYIFILTFILHGVAVTLKCIEEIVRCMQFIQIIFPRKEDKQWNKKKLVFTFQLKYGSVGQCKANHFKTMKHYGYCLMTEIQQLFFLFFFFYKPLTAILWKTSESCLIDSWSATDKVLFNDKKCQ